MSNTKNETVREIVAEMRMDSTDRNLFDAIEIRDYADRLYAALAREAELADDEQWAPRHEAPTSLAPTPPAQEGGTS